MIATAHSGQTDLRIADAQSRPGENVLLASCDRIETEQYAGYLDDVYGLFLAGTERLISVLLDSQAIQVIILNTGPGNFADGMRLCARLKSAPQSGHLPVIILIDEHDVNARIGFLRSGADACIEKPLSRDHLRAQIRNLLSNRDRLKSYFSQPFLSSLEPRRQTGEKQAFAKRLNGLIAANMHDVDLNVDGLASMMNISKPTLYRRVKDISRQTPNGLVNFIRLNKAAELLSTGEFKVFKIALMVGFASRSNFGRSFVKQFGLTPKEYVEMLKKL